MNIEIEAKIKMLKGITAFVIKAAVLLLMFWFFTGYFNQINRIEENTKQCISVLQK